MKKLAILFLAVGLAACGSSDGGGNNGGGTGGSGGGAISSGPLSGKIAGVPWTFVDGQTNDFLSGLDTTRWVADMYDVAIDSPCSGFPPDASMRSLILTVPRVVGTYHLSLDLNETFYDAATNNNYAATSGTVQVTEVTATTVSGGANFAFNADNSVNGQFTFKICPAN